MKDKWAAFTPAGTYLDDTEAKTRDECIDILLNLTSHMPYRNFKDMQKRGYTVEKIR